MEIYPRWLTGPVRKTSSIARALHLASRFEDLDPELKAEIAEGIAATDAGEEGIPAEEVLAGLRRRTEAYRAV